MDAWHPGRQARGHAGRHRLEAPGQRGNIRLHPKAVLKEGTGLAVPGSFFTNLKIDNAEEIKKVQQPFLWIHGIEDAFLSYENHGMSVWNNYQGIRGEKVSVPGGGHGTVVKTMGVAAYSEAVLGFIVR